MEGKAPFEGKIIAIWQKHINNFLYPKQQVVEGKDSSIIAKTH